MKAVLAGGSGFLGRALTRRLVADGWEVVVLTREPDKFPAAAAGTAVRAVAWNGETAGAWRKELDGATALVNFAGRSIECVHTLEHSREILESRLNATQALGRAVAMVKQPPAVWVQCSATGYYGNSGHEVRAEDAPAGRGFLAEVCRRWEEAFAAVELKETRRVTLRLGVVLDRDHGVLPLLRRLVGRYLGGRAGNGRQYFSWIHREDLVAIMVAALVRPDFTGVYNACAPAPVTNRDLMRRMRSAVGRPWCPPAPAPIVRLVAHAGLKIDSKLVLHGQRAVPARLTAAGFEFKFGTLAAALDDLIDRKAAPPAPVFHPGGSDQAPG